MTISWLIDSNVLVYAFFRKTDEAGEEEPEKKLRADSRQIMTLAAQGALSGAVAQQNLLEFLAIVTSPKRVASPIKLQEALKACQSYLSFCTLVTPKPSTYLTFETLTKEKKVARERLFDLYLAATAIDNNLSHICTWNTKHFRHLPGLRVATPSEVLKSLVKNQQEPNRSGR
jgi:predicted nucleic acid-binding protein